MCPFSKITKKVKITPPYCRAGHSQHLPWQSGSRCTAELGTCDICRDKVAAGVLQSWALSTSASTRWQQVYCRAGHSQQLPRQSGSRCTAELGTFDNCRDKVAAGVLYCRAGHSQHLPQQSGSRCTAELGTHDICRDKVAAGALQSWALAKNAATKWQ